MIPCAVMNWDDLRIIAAVRQKGTFAGAGKELRLDETTVARRLGRIQATLGVTLFDAVDGLRRPTQHCLAVLADIDEITRRVAKITSIGRHFDGPTGNIRITSTPSIAEDFLAPRMADFLRRNSGLSLELKISDANVNFSRWEADLAIRLGKPAKGAFIIRKLAEIKFYLFRPAEIAANITDPIVCAYPEELEKTPEMVQLEQAGLTGQTRLRTSSVRIIRAVIESHAGIGILPEHLAQDLFSDAGLKATALKSRREVWLLIQPHLQNDPATRLTVDWIAGALKSP